MNKRFLLALGGAIFFGLLAILVAQSYLQSEVEKNRAQDEADVVIATTDIPIGTTITAQQIRVARYRRDLIPDKALTKKEAVVDRVAVVEIAAKTPIVDRYLAAPDSPAGVPGILPAGMRAVSVRVDEASSVAGFALSGTYVDVIVIMQPMDRDAKPVSKIVLQNVRVLANGQQMQARSDGKPALVNTVTLQVTPEQAEKLKLAEAEGKLQLVIRNSTDQIVEKTRGATKADVLNDPALEARALKGVRREGSRPAQQPIPPFPQPAVIRPATASTPSAPTRIVIPVELIEGNKRTRIEFLP
jgi:pilus assembly protein CpaB